LSQSIVVKEHRIRYQKEQWDRFLISVNNSNLKDRNLTLREFAKKYACMIDNNIAGSFHYRTPKIEANYDDYDSKTLRPLNATIFMYFFSSTGASKNFAQWMLSTIRYPNEKMR